jgi:PTH1 family peptidyl-tRNA hydrolase
MLYFYGLGNNDQQYFGTKHNLGRELVEELGKELHAIWKQVKGLYVGKSGEVELWYSSAFMNHSGVKMMDYLDYRKLEFQEEDLLIIVQDDSDQISGNVKLTQAGGSAGHRGINDIYKYIPNSGLSMDQVWRLKIGIRPPENKLRSETFVLHRSTDEEKRLVKELSKTILKNLDLFKQKELNKLQTVIHTQFQDKP